MNIRFWQIISQVLTDFFAKNTLIVYKSKFRILVIHTTNLLTLVNILEMVKTYLYCGQWFSYLNLIHGMPEIDEQVNYQTHH